MSDTYKALVLNAPKHEVEGLDRYDVDEYVVQREKSLAFLQGAVGGIVECIDVRHPTTGEVATLWIGEEAKMQGRERNRFAEEVAANGGWAGAEWGDWIAGAVVVTGIDFEEGETVSIPDNWVTLVETLAALGQGDYDAVTGIDPTPIQHFGPEGPQ